MSDRIEFSPDAWSATATILGNLEEASVVQADGWAEFFPITVREDDGDWTLPRGPIRDATLEDVRDYLEAQLNSLFAAGTSPHAPPLKKAHDESIRRIERSARKIEDELAAMGIGDEPAVAAAVAPLRSLINQMLPPRPKWGRKGRDQRWVAYVSLLIDLWSGPFCRRPTVSKESALAAFVRAASMPVASIVQPPEDDGLAKLLQIMVKAKRQPSKHRSLLRRLDFLTRQGTARSRWKK